CWPIHALKAHHLLLFSTEPAADQHSLRSHIRLVCHSHDSGERESFQPPGTNPGNALRRVTLPLLGCGNAKTHLNAVEERTQADMSDEPTGHLLLNPKDERTRC